MDWYAHRRVSDSHTRRLPTTEELFELPIDTLPERIVEIAERVTGSAVGLYVIDLEGVALLQLVGDVSLPAEVPIPQMPGPEIPTGHLAALERSMAARGIGQIVPLWLRHRAIAVFLVDGSGGAELETFAGQAAGALELSLRYSDRVNGARHRQRATAGAELQQQLLPPRMAGVRGAEIAGSVLPAYDVGGDWFDHAADRDGAWLAVADAAGKGGRASAVSALSLAAFRAARQAGASLTEAAMVMDQAVVGFGDSSLFVTSLLARWDAASRTLEWLTCGHLPPCRLSRDGVVDELAAAVFPPLGVLDGVRLATTRSLLVPGDRVVLYSDGVVERRSLTGRLGRSGFFEHIAAIDQPSAASLLTHIISHVSAAHETPLDDDATVLVLGILDDRAREPAPHPPALEPGPEGA
jgi:serine phosphatase RsbU (regulator of sigma subunit)